MVSKHKTYLLPGRNEGRSKSTFRELRIWTAIPDKNINICRLCGALNSYIIRHSVAECRVTLPLKEHFIHWVMNENGIELHNKLISCDPEHFLIKILGARYDSQVPDEHLNVLISCGFLFIKECIDFAE